MSQNSFTSPTGFGMPTGGLASRRGGQGIKPLSMEAIKSPSDVQDNGAPTPRTSRSHLLAGLRTAPKSATAATFPASPTSAVPPQQMRGYTQNQQNAFNGPKTSLPRFASQQHHQQQQQQQQQQHQQQHQQQPQAYGQMMGVNQQHYTAEQILAPPELHLDEQDQAQMDPSLYAQLVATNMYLAQQQQRLQQQLISVQAAAQQFQGLNLTGQQQMQQQLALQSLYQQQQQLQNLQMQSLAMTQAAQQPNIYSYYDPATGQQSFFVDQNASQVNNQYQEVQQASAPGFGGFQQTPRVQVSPPPADNNTSSFRSNSPPKKTELTVEPTPLPPPSANAFRRGQGHKKTNSQAISRGISLNTEDVPKSAGPKTASFPLTPFGNGGYGPGQGRAGEHPIRQPRGPPALDELKAKPTSRFEGSKNFAARTRRSAVHNLVRAGLERRKGTGSSTGSMSPVSETAEELATPLTDNDSDSGRSGSGSLDGDAEPSLASSRTSTSGSWGAIGSDRPHSRQKTRKSADSFSSGCESDNSFAGVFKNSTPRASRPQGTEGRKAPMLVLTSADKRKNGVVVA